MNASQYWTKAGFSEISTGGGCVAFHKPVGNRGAHVLVTSSEYEGNLPTEINELVDVGLYDEQGQALYSVTALGSMDAKRWITKHEIIAQGQRQI